MSDSNSHQEQQSPVDRALIHGFSRGYALALKLSEIPMIGASTAMVLDKINEDLDITVHEREYYAKVIEAAISKPASDLCNCEECTKKRKEKHDL